MINLKEMIDADYGTKKMKLQNLWICFFFLALMAFTDWVIRYNTYGLVYEYILIYLKVFIVSTGISIFISTLFSNGPSNKTFKWILLILTTISLAVTFMLLIPLGLALKTKQVIEMLSRFRLDETKPMVYMVSIAITSLISAFYFGVGIVLYPLVDQQFSGEYLFILIFMSIVIFSFNLLSKWTYLLFIATTKSYSSKRQLLQAYFHDFKEKNIVLFIILFFSILYIYAQKNQDGIMLASASSITTIILLDALVEKWKNRFHKTDTEYRFAEFLNMDIQMVYSQIELSNLSNINMKLKPNIHIELMRHINLTTTNKSYKKIIGVYESLISDYLPYDKFIKILYDLESRIITFIIKCN